MPDGTAYYCTQCNAPINANGDCGCGRRTYYFEDDDE